MPSGARLEVFVDLAVNVKGEGRLKTAQKHGWVSAGNSNENGKEALGFSSEIGAQACRRCGKHPRGWKTCTEQVTWLRRGNGRSEWREEKTRDHTTTTSKGRLAEGAK